MIALTPEEGILPHYKWSVEDIQTWRNRYSMLEYPKKVMIYTFYRQHTINFMWEILYSPFSNRTPKFFDFNSAREHISKIFVQTKMDKTVSMDFLQTKVDVGGLKHNFIMNLVNQETNKAIEELEFTYIYYYLANELLFRWSAFGMIGKNKLEAFIAVTGVGVNTDGMNDYANSLNLLGQVGISPFLSKYYSPLPNFY